jgi:hypothetical protein
MSIATELLNFPIQSQKTGPANLIISLISFACHSQGPLIPCLCEFRTIRSATIGSNHHPARQSSDIHSTLSKLTGSPSQQSEEKVIFTSNMRNKIRFVFSYATTCRCRLPTCMDSGRKIDFHYQRRFAGTGRANHDVTIGTFPARSGDGGRSRKRRGDACLAGKNR